MKIILKNITTIRNQKVYTVGGIPNIGPDFTARVDMIVPGAALTKMIGDNGEWLEYLSEQLSFHTPGTFIVSSSVYNNKNGEETYCLSCHQSGLEYPTIDVISQYLANVFTYQVEFGDNCVIFNIIE